VVRTSVQPSHASSREQDPVPVFQCDALLADGNRCTYRGTRQQLGTHRRIHGLHVTNPYVISNKCLLCNTIFSSIKHARAHVLQAYNRQQCPIHRVTNRITLHNVHVLPSRRFCAACETELGEHEWEQHMKTHLQQAIWPHAIHVPDSVIE